MKMVDGYITRKSMIYESAVEYGELAMTPCLGCAHACSYCYAYSLKHRTGEIKTRDEWKKVKPVANMLELVKKEIPKVQKLGKSVTLSFMTDAFMYNYPEVCRLSLDALKLLNDSGVQVVTITKGVLPYELVFLSKDNMHGITLESLDENFRLQTSPGSAPYVERINSLYALHQAGLKTWVSIEPYFTPNIIQQDLHQLLESISFVDRIVFGRANYCTAVTAYPYKKEFYNQAAAEVMAFCNARGIECIIKEGTIS